MMKDISSNLMNKDKTVQEKNRDPLLKQQVPKPQKNQFFIVPSEK
jgi:hypothetical protein